MIIRFRMNEYTSHNTVRHIKDKNKFSGVRLNKKIDPQRKSAAKSNKIFLRLWPTADFLGFI